MSNIIKRSLEIAHLRSIIENPKTNEDNRTIELVWSTGFKGLRNGWDGSYYEELSMDTRHVDLTRLQAGAPLLASHDSSSLDSVIGVVERAWIEGNQGKALVRFSSDPEADKIYQKVKEKILRNVSVGYQVRKYEDVTSKGDSVPTYRATNWQPHEISIVPIGFDPQAQIRKSENSKYEVEITMPQKNPSEEKESSNMSDKNAALAERQRAQEIRQAVRSAKLEESFADELVNTEGMTADQARKLVLDKLVSMQPDPISSAVRVENGSDNHSKRRQAFEDAILHRLDGRNFKVTESGRNLFGRSLIQAAEYFVPRYSMESDVAYAKRALSSSAVV